MFILAFIQKHPFMNSVLGMNILKWWIIDWLSSFASFKAKKLSFYDFAHILVLHQKLCSLIVVAVYLVITSLILILIRIMFHSFLGFVINLDIYWPKWIFNHTFQNQWLYLPIRTWWLTFSGKLNLLFHLIA